MYKINIFSISDGIKEFNRRLVPGNFKDTALIILEDSNMKPVFIFGVAEKTDICENDTVSYVKSLTYKGKGKESDENWTYITPYNDDTEIYHGKLDDILKMVEFIQKNKYMSLWRIKKAVYKYAQRKGVERYTHELLVIP